MTARDEVYRVLALIEDAGQRDNYTSMYERDPDLMGPLIVDSQAAYERGLLAEGQIAAARTWGSQTANPPTRQQVQAFNLYGNSPETLQAEIDAAPDGQGDQAMDNRSKSAFQKQAALRNIPEATMAAADANYERFKRLHGDTPEGRLIVELMEGDDELGNYAQAINYFSKTSHPPTEHELKVMKLYGGSATGIGFGKDAIPASPGEGATQAARLYPDMESESGEAAAEGGSMVGRGSR